MEIRHTIIVIVTICLSGCAQFIEEAKDWKPDPMTPYYSTYIIK